MLHKVIACVEVTICPTRFILLQYYCVTHGKNISIYIYATVKKLSKNNCIWPTNRVILLAMCFNFDALAQPCSKKWLKSCLQKVNLYVHVDRWTVFFPIRPSNDTWFQKRIAFRVIRVIALVLAQYLRITSHNCQSFCHADRWVLQRVDRKKLKPALFDHLFVDCDM